MPAATQPPVSNQLVTHQFQRPPWLLSLVLDVGLAIGAHLASYWLRFTALDVSAFLPYVWGTMPTVVAVQLGMLAAVKAYTPRPRFDWLARVVGGIVLGTGAAGLVLTATAGLEGVSRLAFVADAILLSTLAVGWRGIWVLRHRYRITGGVPSPDLVDPAAEMTTIRSVVASLYGYRELLKNLVLKDLKLKYRGSVFGFLWSLANPLLMAVVYTIAFTWILRIGKEGFVFLLMLGQLSWTFFSSSSMMSTGAIVDNAGLVKSVRFPRAILPIGTVLFNLAQFVLTASVIIPFLMLWYHRGLSAPVLVFPVVLALQTAFTIGLALILATTTAFFRDVRHLLEIALAVLFWTTPIVYRLGDVPEGLRLLVLLSPMSPFVVAYQTMFFNQEWPAGTVWLVASTYALGSFVVGAMLFLAFEDRFTEQL